MRRILSVFLSILIVLAVVPQGAITAHANDDGWITVSGIEGGRIKFDESTGTITDCETTVTVADIPSEINGVAVVSIGDSAFYQCESLTKITIPNCTVSIEDYAFRLCTSLTVIAIPDNVTSIGSYAFWSCISLTEITLPNQLTSIESNTFDWCISLTRITIPNSVTYIGSSAFDGCKSLTEITIPNGIKSISNSTFYECRSLKQVTIPNSVTYIGTYAFRYCESLTQITIPDSVTYTGMQPFGFCTSLTEITIPNSITSIAEYAFYSCTSLTQIMIPNSVKSIGNDAFGNCTSLTEIIIPNSVTHIDEYAFRYCESLKKITIPNSVKSIGSFAFRNCTSLTEVTIPDGITSISDHMFYRCTSLTAMTIPNSVTSIKDHAFYGCALTGIEIPKSVKFIGRNAFEFSPLKDIYYSGTAEEWNRISIGSDITSDNYALKNATIHYNTTTRYDNDIPAGKYLIKVADGENNAISGATVTYDKQSGTTDKKGEILFDARTTPIVTVSKSGYISWSNKNSNWKESSDRYETIVLFDTSVGEYKLASATYSNSEDYSGSTVDLLTQTKKLSLKASTDLTVSLDFGDFYLRTVSLSPDRTEKYQLWQGAILIEESENGEFKLNVESFSSGGDCRIRVIANDGKHMDTHINLEFAKNSVNKNEMSTSIGKGISFAVADDIPYFGGTTLSLDFDELPVDIEVTSSKIHIGFNIKELDSKSQNVNETEQEKLTRWEKLKESFDTAEKAGALDLSSANVEEFKKLMKEDKDFSLPGTGRVKAYFSGYAEADLGSSTATGKACILISANTKTYGFQTAIVWVPVTVSIKAGASASLSSKVTYSFKTNQLDFESDLDITINLKAFGGIGINNAVAVGAYGEAKAGIDWRISPIFAGLSSFTLSGELGLRAFLGPFTWEKPFANNTWYLYTANNVQALQTASLTDDSIVGSIYDISSYTLEDFSYIANESNWLGKKSAYSGYAMPNSAKVEINSLLNSTYRNAQPTLVGDGNRLYGAFLRANADGSVYTSVTVFDGESWSNPVSASLNSEMDDAPQLYITADGTVFLAYAQTKTGADKTNAIEYLKNQSIVVGTLSEDGIFTMSKTITPSIGYRVNQQTFGSVDGQPVLAWVESKIENESDVFTPNKSIVKMSVYNGTTWEVAQTVAELAHPIYQIAAGGEGVAVLYDADDDLTTSDAVLALYNSSKTQTVLSSSVNGKVSYVTLPTGTSTFVWNDDNALITASGKTIETDGITSDYQVTESGIYYSAVSDNGSDLVKVAYADGNWSEPITLTDGKRYLENLNVATLDGDDYAFGMHTETDITEDAVTLDKNLVWSKVIPVNDLRIDSVSYDESIVTPGENIPVKVTIVNAGDHTVENAQLLLGEESVESVSNLVAGESRELTINIPRPSALTEYTLTVKDDQTMVSADYTPSNNTEKIKIGYGNLSVKLSYEQIGSARNLVAVVENTGVNPISGLATFYDDEGDEYGITKIKELSAGDIAVVRLEVPEKFSSRFGGDVTVNVESEDEEIYDFDNTATLNITEVTSAEITTVTVGNSTVRANISYQGRTNSATAYCAFYDQNGKMLELTSTAVSTNKTSYSFEKKKGAVIAKVFVLDSNWVTLCENKQVTISN